MKRLLKMLNQVKGSSKCVVLIPNQDYDSVNHMSKGDECLVCWYDKDTDCFSVKNSEGYGFIKIPASDLYMFDYQIR